MLKNLLKYDLKDTYKILIIFYILSLFFGVLTRIFFSIENSFIMDVIAKVCSGITISMIFNVIINNILRLWVRFKQNLYGDESYLTHTLPVSRKTIYLSKSLASVISLFTSVVVIGMSLFIAYYSKENIELLKSILLPIANAYGSTIIKILLAFLFIFFLEFANALQAGYTGIILGHKVNGGKIGLSVLFGSIVYMATQLCVLTIIFICALFNTDLMNLFNTKTMIDLNTMSTVIYLTMATYSLVVIALYFVNVKLLQKGVNID